MADERSHVDVPPVVYDQTSALDKDSVTVWILALKMGLYAPVLWVRNFDLLVRVWGHCLQPCIVLAIHDAVLLEAGSATRQASGSYSLECRRRVTVSFIDNCHVALVVNILMYFLIWGRFSYLYLFYVEWASDLIRVRLLSLSHSLMHAIVLPEILGGLGKADLVGIPGDVDV